MEANSRMPLGPGLTSPDDKENSTPNKMNTSRPNSRSESAQALKTTNTNGTDHDKSVELGAKSRESLARNLQLASQDPNPAVRKAAQSALISAEEKNLTNFLVALVVVDLKGRGQFSGRRARQGLPASASAQVQADRAIAIATALQQAGAQDVVLIAGKGHENYQEIRGQKLPFSDRALAEAALVSYTAQVSGAGA